MSPVSLFLLVVAMIFLIGIIGEIVFAKTGIPDVIWLILVGIALGPIGGFVTREQLQTIAPYFGALTLVVVLFDGGSELKLKELSLAAGRGTVLSVFGFVLAVAAVAGVSFGAARAGVLPSEWGWTQCLLLGTILGGSSSVVIMPALRHAGLSTKISNLVNLESALTDVLSVVATGAGIQIAIAQSEADAATGGSASGAAAEMLGKSFLIGIGLGALVGFFAVLLLRRVRKSAYAYPLTLGTLLVLYVIVDELGGSAALAILAAAVMVGNAPTLSKVIGLAKTARIGRNVEGVHDEMTFIIKSFFFCFIGAMLGPPWGLLLFGVFLGVVLLLARLPNVALSTIKSGMSKPARSLVAVLMPRGMAAGVLAMAPDAMGVPHTRELPVVVFAAVFTTILLFAVGFPVLRRRLPASDLAPVEDPKGKPAPAKKGEATESDAGEASVSTTGSTEMSTPEFTSTAIQEPPVSPSSPADATVVGHDGAAPMLTVEGSADGTAMGNPTSNDPPDELA